jgi:hypothetical protein
MHNVIKKSVMFASVVALAASTMNCANSPEQSNANVLAPSSVGDAALAARGGAGGGGGGGGKPSGGGGTLALAMVSDVNADGLPNRGDSVTFKITTSVTTQPYVELICKQDGRLVFGKTAGYFDGYMWPWSQVMLLSSDLWTGGAASCTAELYYNNKLTRTNLTTISFTAYP